MLYWQAIILSIVEGLTEFIPVSSTGHMLLFSYLINFNPPIANTFVIFIQLGAIFAVFGIYYNSYLRVFSNLIASKSLKDALFQKQFPSISHFFLAIVPISIVGFLFYSFIKGYLFGVYPVLIGLFVGGVIMILADKYCVRFTVQKVEDITLRQSFLIGLAQAFALWPGVSRSGSTIVAGLLLKVDYKPSADFSFMVACPIMFLAVAYDLFKSKEFITLESIELLAIGFFGAFIVAFFSIKWFLKILPRLKLFPFGVYRIVVSLSFALFLFLSQ